MYCPDRNHPYKIATTCKYCIAIREAREDERVKLSKQSADCVVFEQSNGIITAKIDDPYHLGWIAVSIEVMGRILRELQGYRQVAADLGEDTPGQDATPDAEPLASSG